MVRIGMNIICEILCASIQRKKGILTVAIGNPKRHIRKASHHGSKQQ